MNRLKIVNRDVWLFCLPYLSRVWSKPFLFLQAHTGCAFSGYQTWPCSQEDRSSQRYTSPQKLIWPPLPNRCTKESPSPKPKVDLAGCQREPLNETGLQNRDLTLLSGRRYWKGSSRGTLASKQKRLDHNVSRVRLRQKPLPTSRSDFTPEGRLCLWGKPHPSYKTGVWHSKQIHCCIQDWNDRWPTLCVYMFTLNKQSLQFTWKRTDCVVFGLLHYGKRAWESLHSDNLRLRFI